RTYTISCGYGPNSSAGSATVTITVNGSSGPPSTGADLTAGGVSPAAATVNSPQTFSATISNIGDTSTGAGFADLFQKASDASGTGASDIGGTYSNNALSGGASYSTSLSYTFPSAGTYYMRVCADKSSAGDTGVITESNENNNCGAWTAISVQDVCYGGGCAPGGSGGPGGGPGPGGSCQFGGP